MKIILKIEYSKQAPTTTNESSMSGTTTTAAKHELAYNNYITSTEYGSQIFNGQRGEYGIFKFADPHRQMTYEHHETRFKKMQHLKNAYDKQELLRRMRADIRREYLTRKNQMKRLQMDAAVDFRNAESSLQEHYATEAAADHYPYIHGVDIRAPLVSKIQLPNAQILDLKTFDEESEFAKVCQVHADLLADQQESIRLSEQEEQRQSQYYAIQQRWMEREYGQQRPHEQPRDQEEQEQRQCEEQEQEQGQGREQEQRWSEAEKEVWNNWVKRQYLQRSAYETRRVVELRNEVQENTEGDMPQLCLEESRHDSDYCGPFGYYPRGEVPRERHEAGLASIRRRAQAEQQKEEEEQVGRYGDGGFCGCGDLECSDCFSYGPDENDDRDSYDSDYDGIFPDYPREYNWEIECREAEEAAAAQAAAEQQRWEENTRDSDDETWDEEARANEAEHRREVALMKLNDDMTYTCDDHPDVQQLEVVTITEPKARITASAASSGAISAQKKAAAGAAKKAAKARQAKQELKKKEKFVPFKITANTNRVPVPVSKECCNMEEEETTTTTLLYQGKAQVNLPKKNLQNVSREGKRRHIAIWRRIETEEKHASARGTRIANIPEPSAWYNCGGSDNDYDY